VTCVFGDVEQVGCSSAVGGRVVVEPGLKGEWCGFIPCFPPRLRN
jgi:hypothetical protein